MFSTAGGILHDGAEGLAAPSPSTASMNSLSVQTLFLALRPAQRLRVQVLATRISG